MLVDNGFGLQIECGISYRRCKNMYISELYFLSMKYDAAYFIVGRHEMSPVRPRRRPERHSRDDDDRDSYAA